MIQELPPTEVPPDLPQIPLEALMGPDPNVVMLDQLVRNLVMFGIEALVWVIIASVAYLIVKKIVD